jgi:anti-sigma B factor antagonist
MDLGMEVDDSRGAHVVLKVSGEVDIATAPKLREKLVELAGGGATRVVVDLDGVDFLDSTGLGVLIGGMKRLRGVDGDLSLVCTQARILKVFEITGLNRAFTIHDTVDAAVAG